MEKQSLIDLFFVGNRADVEAFVEPLKARCLLPTDRTINVDGHIERLVEYTVNGVQKYISQNMTFYEECPECGDLEPSESFRVVEIARYQQIRPEGARYYKKTERVCQHCLDASHFIVKEHFCAEGEEKYLYRANQHTVRILAGVENGTSRYVWTDDRYLRNHQSEVFDTAVVTVTNEGRFQMLEIGLRLAGLTSTVWKEGLPYEILPTDLETFKSQGFFGECPQCGRIVWHEDIENGHCPSCSNVQIYNYHGFYSYDRGNHELQFMKSVDDDASEKMYFGVEIETAGSETNRRFVSPIADICHLEHDASLPRGGFEMISEPMTWKYILENKNRFQEAFEQLSAHGQKSHDSSSCGFHIHVSRAAFKNKAAINRAVAIVHGLRREMEKFGRRQSGSYYAFHSISPSFSRREFESIDQRGHSCAVNTQHENGNDKKTVEFRFPKGTLNVNTFIATICLIKNIVAMANSSQRTVYFGDLIQDECIQSYIEQRSQYVTFNNDAYVSFVRYDTEESFNKWVLHSNEGNLMDFLNIVQDVAGVNISVSQRQTAVEGGAE